MIRRPFFILVVMLCASQGKTEPFSYAISESQYLWSTYFEMQGIDRYIGRVVKNHYNVRTVYDLYDFKNAFEAQGVCQFLSLGALYPWAKDIDVYDERGVKIGFIDGQLLTTAAAKYGFYNNMDELVANAYLDAQSSGFTIMTPDERTIARYKRNFVQDDLDFWNIDIYDSDEVDLRLLKIFSGFAIDFQEFFKEDK